MSIKCKPYHYKHRAVIIGDAAHAMVPFYGQGMNCGFEDVSVLSSILDKHTIPGTKPTPEQLTAALSEYTATRHPAAHAMCDLALWNYEEMRASVTHASYKLRKVVEGALHWLMPSRIIPLYTMVSFSRIPYDEVVRRWRRQTRWLVRGCWAGGIGFCGLCFWGLFRSGLIKKR